MIDDFWQSRKGTTVVRQKLDELQHFDDENVKLEKWLTVLRKLNKHYEFIELSQYIPTSGLGL
jgi:hypothetical protein